MTRIIAANAGSAALVGGQGAASLAPASELPGKRHCACQHRADRRSWLQRIRARRRLYEPLAGTWRPLGVARLRCIGWRGGKLDRLASTCWPMLMGWTRGVREQLAGAGGRGAAETSRAEGYPLAAMEPKGAGEAADAGAGAYDRPAIALISGLATKPTCATGSSRAPRGRVERAEDRRLRDRHGCARSDPDRIWRPDSGSLTPM